MARQAANKKQIVFWRAVVTAVLIVAAIAVLTMHWQTVSASLRTARKAQLDWLVIALASMAATFCIAASLYDVLALHYLRYRQTVIVELATAFVNRLLPSGLGGLGLNGVYLYKRKHTVAEATAIVSINNLIGMLAHMGLFISALLLYPSAFRQFASGLDIHFSWQAALAVVLTMGVIVSLPKVKRRIFQFMRNVWHSLRKLQKAALLVALALAILLTATYTVILYSVAHSLGLSITPLRAFIIFSVGMLTGTATPTPGGLIGAEAGLFAGFVAYDVPEVTAGAAVLLFRLVTYWLPLFPGVAALFLARHKKLI